MFIKMDIEQGSLLPTPMSLKGFTREMLKPVGAITLPITMGVRTHASMAITNFVVVKAHSSYNAIVGYPTLSKMRSVTLIYHLKIRFSIDAFVRHIHV